MMLRGRFLLFGLLFFIMTSSAPAQEACLKHLFTTAKAESTDTSIVSSGEWNDCHKSTTGTDGQRLLKDASQRTTLRWAPSPARESFRGLHLRTHPDNDKAASQVMLVHADEIVLDGGEATGPWDLAVADITKTGAGGLDTGSELASTWYEVYGIWALNGPAPTPAPTVAIGAAGNVNAGLHSWKLTFVSATGETLGSVASATLNPGVASQINLTAIAIGPIETTSRKVYRTATGDTAAWKLVGTINNNTDTTFTDNVADASLGADLPSAAAAPATAPVAAVGAAGNVNAGQHSWRVTFVETRGETIGGTISSPINLSVASQVNLTSVPTGPGGTTTRKIYRTVAGDTGAYKLVGTISDNTTTTFTDNIADGSLGANAPTNTFGSARNLLLHRAKDYFLDETYDVSNADTNFNLRSGSTTNIRLAQGFKVDTAGKVEFMDLYVGKLGAPTGNVWVQLEVDDGTGNKPKASPAAADILSICDKMNVAKFSTTITFVRVLCRTSSSLATATQYHIVLYGDFATSATDNFIWRADGTAATYANGNKAAFDGTVWNSDTTADFIFKLYVTRNDTAVTMPVGWDQKAKLGYVRNDAGSTFERFIARNRWAKPGVDKILGVITTSIPTLQDLSAMIPPGMVRTMWAAINDVAATDNSLAPVPDGFGYTFADIYSFGANLRQSDAASGGNIRAPMGELPTEHQGVYAMRSPSGNAQFFLLGWEW